ncbi:hypothetical protein F5146DRAFT_1124170 [Armillaria mellea]|nr:hypothetical protein F5146DRAFT_1124170 [Armillaria mellea]
MDNTASPMHSSASCQEHWACSWIPTYRAVLRKGKEFHDVYLHGLFVAYYDRFSTSFGELANPADIELIHAWTNRGMEQMNPTEFRALQHSPMDTPSDGPGDTEILGAGEPTSGNVFAGPPKVTSIRKSERIATKCRLNPNSREAPLTKRRRQNTSSELTL